VVAAVGASTAVIVAALILAGGIREPLLSVPNVVALRVDVARAQIMHSLPSATVTVQRVYSTRVPAGRVIRQRPLPRTTLHGGSQVRLVVSKGTPFAWVPAAAGVRARTAKAVLARQGFRSRYLYEPSWTVRKGSVIELRPGTGTRLRRPVSVTIVVASGYPRSFVPDVRGSDLASAQVRLASRHLRYRLVYRLAESVPAGRVLDQIPAAGTNVYQGAQIRLTIARGPRWVRLFAASGTDQYQSDTFSVPARWRIRYRLTANDLGLTFARVNWFADGDFFSSGGFLAAKPDSLFSYLPSDGAGRYRLTLSPAAGTRWYVEVDALR
jgi:beta-lactam-binding protein with PASTA domain